MKDKEIIEEMAIIISGSTEIDTIEYYNALIKAKQIYEIIFPKDSVVLDQEEWERLHNDYAKALYNARQQERKETAKEFAEKVKEKALSHCKIINCYELKFIEETIDELLRE